MTVARHPARDIYVQVIAAVPQGLAMGFVHREGALVEEGDRATRYPEPENEGKFHRSRARA